LRKPAKINPVNRIFDANINRAKEGLRVCEEITRFILNNRALTARLKSIRHSIDALVLRLPESRELLKTRASSLDVGRKIYTNELQRRDMADIFFANIQRVKESIRVLEEFSKLSQKRLAVSFKELRYEVYEVEKRAAKGISSLKRFK